MTKPSALPTVAQLRARKENYGLFIIDGMLSTIHHLRDISGIDKADLCHTEDMLRTLKEQIGDVQRERRMHKGINGK